MDWSVLANSDFYAGILRTATPLTLAALGGVMTERSGVTNIGLEGLMLIGAFFGAWISASVGNPWVGVMGAMFFGGLIALIHGVVSIGLRGNQIISGVAINLFGTGITGYLYETYVSNGFTNLPSIPNLKIPGLSAIPGVGPVIGVQNSIVYIMLALVAITHLVLFHTTLGLRIRAVGEQPRAADTVGVNVYALRYLCVTISGMLAGLGGAYLSLGLISNFSINMTSGKGFIALAAMIVGKWTPLGALTASLLFGFGLQIQTSQLVNVSSFASNMVTIAPYLITLIAVAGFIGRATAPAADGVPYDPTH
ncbi:MAG TPA: ABC transporter permease [Chloroflexota bacterium]|nr:ABC transporter permease [Chloroflexota bacterium]